MPEQPPIKGSYKEGKLRVRGTEGSIQVAVWEELAPTPTPTEPMPTPPITPTSTPTSTPTHTPPSTYGI